MIARWTCCWTTKWGRASSAGPNSIARRQKRRDSAGGKWLDEASLRNASARQHGLQYKWKLPERLRTMARHHIARPGFFELGPVGLHRGKIAPAAFPILQPPI